jgi:hypothetical protein
MERIVVSSGFAGLEVEISNRSDAKLAAAFGLKRLER